MSAPTPMYYSEFEPSPELKPWIAAHWNFRVEPDAGPIEHWVPLTGGAIVAVALRREATIVGPRAEVYQVTVHGGDCEWGTHFWPGAAAALLGCGGEDLRGQEAWLGDLVDRKWVDRLISRLQGVERPERGVEALDTAFGELLPEASPLDETVMTAVFRILSSGGRRLLADVANSVGLSPRQLRRRFRPAVGLTPKELARVQRLRESAVNAVAVPGERWVDIAAEHGYADQPHLVREFRRLLGLTPVAFASHAGRIRHGRIVR